MTNDVEKLILDNIEFENINFKEQISYFIYKEIWDFILRNINSNPHHIRVSFKIKKISNEYCILDYYDINYSLHTKENIFNYSGYNVVNNNLIIKSMFDLTTLYMLLEKDKFTLDTSMYKGFIIINVMIDNDKINDIIDSVLLKNGKVKKLSKED